MKKITLLLILLTVSFGYAQTNPIDFESTSSGDWTWNVFENDTPPLELIANPFPDATNGSATVAKFTALQSNAFYAGCVNNTDFSTFTLDATNSTVTIMVYKSVISPVGIKFEADLASTGEILQSNTLINQWEEMTFDFSGKIGEPSSTDIDGIVVFPDFANPDPRTQDNIIYFDNITFSGQAAPTAPTDAPEAPTEDEVADNVVSVYSDAYTDVGNDGLNNFNSGSILSVETIANNDVLKYSNLDFTGLEFLGPNLIDASAANTLHLDVWSPDANELKIKLVDFGADEAFQGGDDTEFEINFGPTAVGEWISYDIPLADFTGLTNTDNLAQIILVNGPAGTLFIDNIYFYNVVPPPSLEDITFEPGEPGNAWTWAVFENDTPPLEIVANPFPDATNGSATVAKFTALQTNACYAGTVNNTDLPTFTLDATNSTVKIMVYKSVISPVGVKFEADLASTGEILQSNTLINQWEEMTFDFSGKIGEPSSTNINGIVVFMDFTCATDPRDQDNVTYFDTITFSEQMLPQEPTDAPEAPTEDATLNSVISVYSDTYNDVGNDGLNNFNSGSLLSIENIANNNVLKYTNLNFTGLEFLGPNLIDASGATTLHLDVWSPDANELKIKLVDFGANQEFDGGDDSEFEINFGPTATGQWIAYDIPLSDFAGLASRENLAQIILVNGPAGTLFIDNIYFYDNLAPPTEPSIAAPTPTLSASDVISLFSDPYTDVPVDTWNTVWSDAVFADVNVAGNPTKKYTNLNFNGIETVASPVDASTMAYFHLDVWTPNITALRVKLVDFLGDGFGGGNGDTEAELTFTPAQGQWVSIDIPLADFASGGMSSFTDVSQYIISGDPSGAGTIFIDNVYFSKVPTLGVNDFEISEFRVYPNPTNNVWTVIATNQINTIQLFDVLGKNVQTITPNANSVNIDASVLQTGLYFAKVSTVSGTKTIKLIRE